MTSAEQRDPMSWGEVAGFALLMGVVALLVFSGRNSAQTLVPVGTPLPPLMAEGWLNTQQTPTEQSAFGKIPSRELLAGKVVVIDCWATWCPPCRAAMPELAQLYAKYQPLGVEFIGLTSESADDRPAIEKFIGSIDGFDWPVGYGAMPIQDLLGIEVLPTVIVFSPGGSAVWSNSQLYGIEDALDQALGQVPR